MEESFYSTHQYGNIYEAIWNNNRRFHYVVRSGIIPDKAISYVNIGSGSFEWNKIGIGQDEYDLNQEYKIGPITAVENYFTLLALEKLGTWNKRNPVIVLE